MLPNVPNKLICQAGETLLETLFSVTIVMLSIGMVATAASVASSTNIVGNFKAEKVQNYLAEAETQQEPLVIEGRSVVAQANVSSLISAASGNYSEGPTVASGAVTIYGNDDLYSYKAGIHPPVIEAAAELYEPNPYEEVINSAATKGAE